MDGMGWIMMVLIGGVAGLVASRITKTTHSLFGNVLLGILGAVGMNAVLRSAFDLHLEGVIGQLVTSVLGATAIIVIFQYLRRTRS